METEKYEEHKMSNKREQKLIKQIKRMQIFLYKVINRITEGVDDDISKEFYLSCFEKIEALSAEIQESFIKEGWQKKPAFFKNFFESIEQLELDHRKISQLLCDEYIESRYIKGSHENNNSWTLEHGSFEPNDVEQKMQQPNSCFLVQAIDHHLPNFYQLLEELNFFNHALFDDLMLSIAQAGGSVGAHTDQYDVFLIQMILY